MVTSRLWHGIHCFGGGGVKTHQREKKMTESISVGENNEIFLQPIMVECLGYGEYHTFFFFF